MQLSAKPRVIVMTDIQGDEVDDKQSLIRLLVYSNEYDIVGIIPTTSCWVTGNLSYGEDFIHAAVDAYESDLINLVKHAEGWPDPDYLRSVIKKGNEGSDFWSFGNGLSSAGSNQIISAVDASSEPTWICIWGGANTLAQALYDVNTSKTEEGKNAFIAKLRIRESAGQDVAGAWICSNFPDIYWSRDLSVYYAFNITRYDYGIPEILDGDPNFSVRESNPVLHPSFENANIRNHGALGALYPNTLYANEGDTCTFMPLINCGLNDTIFTVKPKLEHGSWGGRYTRSKIENPPASAASQFEHLGVENEEHTYAPYFMYTEVQPGDEDSDDGDSWDSYAHSFKEEYLSNGPAVNNQWAATFRWRTHYEHDFMARMTWCDTANFSDANHPPVAIVNGSLARTAAPGETITLSAAGSNDPDGDNISFHWYFYKEAGTYNGIENINANITGRLTKNASFNVPLDAVAGEHIHIILTVADDGNPPLVRYKRVIVTVS